MKLLRILFITCLMLVVMWVFGLKYLDEEIPVQGKEQVTEQGQWFPHYQIQATFDPAHRRMEGTLILVYRNTGSSKLEELQFNLIGNLLLHGARTIRVSQAEINGRTSTFTQEPYRVVLPLALPLLPDKELKIELKFQTEIPVGPGRFGSQGGIYSLTAWYPVLAPLAQGKWVNLLPVTYAYGDPYYTQSAYYDGNIKLPASIQVVAGSELMPDQSKEHWKTWSFSSNQPQREFALVFSNKYRFLRQTVDGVNLIYAYEGLPRKEVLPAAARSLKLFSSLWGPYPYKQLTMVETPLSGLAGMEYPGLVLLNNGGGYAEYTVAHEVAHQWWYGLVGNDQVKEPWIDESLANYSALLYLRKYRPVEYQDRFVSYEDRVFGHSLDMNRELGEYRTPEEYRIAVYVKGALFWEHLGNLIGEEKLVEVLRLIQAEYRFREITTRNLLNTIEEKTDIDPQIIERLLNN
ncbi:MAG: M1 family metallopeptidase [Bacillota bacterium]